MAKRYCKRCKCDTRHDKEVFVNGETGLGRLFLGAVTLGFMEAFGDRVKVYTCQRCGRTTVK